MDIEVFVLIFGAMVGTFILVYQALKTIRDLPSVAEMQRINQDFQLKVNRARSEFGKFSEKSESIVSGALGDMGIDGIMKQFGIEPSILKNPIVRGLVDRYAPKILEQIGKNKGGGESLPPVNW